MSRALSREERLMPTGLPQPAFVLINPQMGENIGSAARGMWNFGLDRMRLVAPRDGWPNPRAVALASGAGRLLDEAQVYAETAGAIADCSFVYATTARPRDLTKLVLTPEEAMRDCAARVAAGERVAVLFGPERTGMENDDIARANAIASVPVNEAFPSLNLASCVLLVAYEWRRASAAAVPARVEMAGSDWAEGVEIEALAAHYEERLEEAGFFFPAHKAESMKLNLRNLWSRQRLTRADVQTFHGMMRQMVRWARRMDRAEGRDGEPRLPGEGAGDR
jgi:tRNA/rRNA methyltransferase